MKKVNIIKGLSLLGIIATLTSCGIKTIPVNISQPSSNVSVVEESSSQEHNSSSNQSISSSETYSSLDSQNTSNSSLSSISSISSNFSSSSSSNNVKEHYVIDNLDKDIPTNLVFTGNDEGNNTTIVYSTLNISKVDLAAPYAIEAGSYMPDASTFLVADGVCEYRQSGWDFVDSAHCGIYPVFLLVDGDEVAIEVEIVDSIEPRFEVQDMNDYIGHQLDPAKFVTDCVDATDVTYTYKTEPDFTKEEQNAIQVTSCPNKSFSIA